MTELQTKSFDQVTKNDSYPSQRRKGTFSWGCFTAERITVLIIIIIIIISSSSSILVKLSSWVRQKKQTIWDSYSLDVPIIKQELETPRWSGVSVFLDCANKLGKSPHMNRTPI